MRDVAQLHSMQKRQSVVITTLLTNIELQFQHPICLFHMWACTVRRVHLTAAFSVFFMDSLLMCHSIDVNAGNLCITWWVVSERSASQSRLCSSASLLYSSKVSTELLNLYVRWCTTTTKNDVCLSRISIFYCIHSCSIFVRGKKQYGKTHERK